MDNTQGLQGLYALENKILGKGSFGTVYLGTDILKDKYVSLKKIPSEIMKDPQKIEALSNEILISSSIENENLVKILDLTDINNEKYIVYEFCNGGDLRRYLRFFKTFDEKSVQYFMTQVLTGLSELHSKKIIHHDIKPENVLVELIPFDIKDNKDPEERKKSEKYVEEILQLTDKKKQNQSLVYGNISNSGLTKDDVLGVVREEVANALGDNFADTIASKMWGNMDKERSNSGSKFDAFMKSQNTDNSVEDNTQTSKSTYTVEETAKALYQRQGAANPIMAAAFKNMK